MAEPVGRGLRPARRSGLTSPETVRTLTAFTATRPPTPAQDPRTSRRTVSGSTNTPENSSWRREPVIAALAIHPVD
jgi:hypothetical protein